MNQEGRKLGPNAKSINSKYNIIDNTLIMLNFHAVLPCNTQDGYSTNRFRGYLLKSEDATTKGHFLDTRALMYKCMHWSATPTTCLVVPG